MIDSPERRYVAMLRELGTIGDGATLCCSVGVVEKMLESCAQMARAEGAVGMYESLYPYLTTREGLAAAKAKLVELQELCERKMAEAAAERSRVAPATGEKGRPS